MFVFHNGDVVGGVRAGDHKLIAYLLFLIFFTAVRILFTAMQDFWQTVFLFVLRIFYWKFLSSKFLIAISRMMLYALFMRNCSLLYAWCTCCLPRVIANLQTSTLLFSVETNARTHSLIQASHLHEQIGMYICVDTILYITQVLL